MYSGKFGAGEHPENYEADRATVLLVFSRLYLSSVRSAFFYVVGGGSRQQLDGARVRPARCCTECNVD